MVGIPSKWAAVIICRHSSAFSLSGHIFWRTSRPESQPPCRAWSQGRFFLAPAGPLSPRPGVSGHVQHLHGRVGMQMHPGKVAMYDLQDLAVILQQSFPGQSPPCRQISVAPSLSASPARSKICFRREEVAITMLERAESAGSCAFIGEVDVSVYDKRDVILAALFPQRIGQAKEAQGLCHSLLQLILHLRSSGFSLSSSLTFGPLLYRAGLALDSACHSSFFGNLRHKLSM